MSNKKETVKELIKDCPGFAIVEPTEEPSWFEKALERIENGEEPFGE